jgi:hypothetical protein
MGSLFVEPRTANIGIGRYLSADRATSLIGVGPKDLPRIEWSE